MRLTLSRHSWALLSICALAGCATFDRPVASTRPAAVDPQDRLAEEVTRKTKSGDIEGARRLLEQAEESKSVGRSHAQSEPVRDSGIQQVGYQTTAPSREEMIRELLQNEAPERQTQKAQYYRDLPFATLKQVYAQDRQAIELGYQRNPQAAPKGNAALEAPNPRAGAFGGSSPWPTGTTNNAGGAGASAPPTAATNHLPSPEHTAPTASTLAVTDNGVTLGGIQPGHVQVAVSGGTNDALPSINPAGPGAAYLPVISPRGRNSPETVAPADASEAFRPSKIEQVNGAVPANGSGATTAGGQMPTTPSGSRVPVESGVATTGNASTGGPATLQPGIEPSSRPTAPGLDRFRRLTNPIPAVAQSAKNAKSALDRGSRNLGLAGQVAADAPPAPAMPPVDQNENLIALIQQLEAQLAVSAPGSSEAEKLQYVRNNVNLRMLYLIAGRNEQALEPIRKIEGDEQEFWQHLMWSIANYFDAQGMPRAADRATQTVAELRTATQKLKTQADLELRSVTFCQRIESYGNFERLSRDHFPPGSAVLLYAEVENFGTTTSEGDRHAAQLKSTIDFYKTGSDKPVNSIPFKVTQDYCRTKRRDFYLSFEFSIPQQFEAGVYTLVLKTEDLVSKKVATARVQFTVE